MHTTPTSIMVDMHVTLPDKADLAALKSTVAEFADHTATRGIPTLTRRLNDYIRTAELAERHWQKVHTSLRFLNGEKAQPTSRLSTSAYKFYSGLSTRLLRQHCAMFGLDYNQYETVDEAIEALVEKHVNEL